jgi:hypothetical protein
MSRRVDVLVMKAMTHIASPEGGDTSTSQSRAINHAPMNYGVDVRFLAGERATLRRIVGLQRVRSRPVILDQALAATREAAGEEPG